MEVNTTPLSEQLRPKRLEDVLGQDHILGPGQLLQQLVARKQPANLIFWGPPGSGKTTLARIIAMELEADFIELSAVSAGVADVREVIKRAEQNQRLSIKTVLFVDEIHRFNKSQQDAFLPHVENGLITLIGATTENPSFEIISPLLSRSRVVVLRAIEKQDLVRMLRRAAKHMKISRRIKAPTHELIADISGGDGRAALNILELAAAISDGLITKQIVQKAAQRRTPAFDKNGEHHYNVISAFIKSMRGSNPHASCYYLARMLQAGEDPKFIARRMIIFASEDIGVAGSAALNLAVSTFAAVERLGMPECQYALYHCAIVLSGSKKSRLVADALTAASQAAADHPIAEVPLHLRNAPTDLMKELGYGKGYKKYVSDDELSIFLPNELTDFSIY